jgi:hypothetical protein
MLYYFSINGLLKEWNKEENMEVTGALTTFCFEQKVVKHFVQ